MEEIKKIAVTPIGYFNAQTKPLIDGEIYYITQEENEKLGKHLLKWSKDSSGHLILIQNDPSEENLKKEKESRIEELKTFLRETDYQAIKYAEGQISASDYAPIKAKREMWRREINTLEES